jgi:hypothetical protein
VLFGFVGAWLVGSGDDPDRDVPRAAGWWAPLAVAVGASVVAGTVMGLLAWWSGGAAGPGRLADVGPAPLPVAGVAAVTVGIGALVGVYAARFRGRRDGFAERDDAAPRPTALADLVDR